jgi:hypothetical protein
MKPKQIIRHKGSIYVRAADDSEKTFHINAGSVDVLIRAKDMAAARKGLKQVLAPVMLTSLKGIPLKLVRPTIASRIDMDLNSDLNASGDGSPNS